MLRNARPSAILAPCPVLLVPGPYARSAIHTYRMLVARLWVAPGLPPPAPGTLPTTPPTTPPNVCCDTLIPPRPSSCGYCRSPPTPMYAVLCAHVIHMWHAYGWHLVSPCQHLAHHQPSVPRVSAAMCVANRPLTPLTPLHTFPQPVPCVLHLQRLIFNCESPRWPSFWRIFRPLGPMRLPKLLARTCVQLEVGEETLQSRSCKCGELWL